MGDRPHAHRHGAEALCPKQFNEKLDSDLKLGRQLGSTMFVVLTRRKIKLPSEARCVGWRHLAIRKHLPQLCANLAPTLLLDANQNITKVKVREVIHNTKKRVGPSAPLMLLRRERKTNKRKEEIEAQLGRSTMRTQIDGQHVIVESPAWNKKKLQLNKERRNF